MRVKCMLMWCYFSLFFSWPLVVAHFDTNLFHYGRVCMLIVVFDNKIATKSSGVRYHLELEFQDGLLKSK